MTKCNEAFFHQKTITQQSGIQNRIRYFTLSWGYAMLCSKLSLEMRDNISASLSQVNEVTYQLK